MEKYIYNEKNGLWYELQGDYYLPCLKLPVPLSPDADVHRSVLRQFQTGQIIVPLQLIPKSVLLVVDVLVHFVILQYD